MRPHEFAKRLGVSVKTLHRWDESGKLQAKRTLSNHRYYTEDDLAVARGLQSVQSKRQVVVYCRVSSPKQKQELKNQQVAMEQFCLARGLEVDEYLLEVGGGMNFKRRQFLSLVIDALEGRVSTIVIAHKDRLCRFAFDLVETLVSRAGVKIIVANQPTLSPHQELVEDLLAIAHCFSCRLYDSRSYANQKVKAVSEILDNPEQYQLKLGKHIQC
jgi:predicted site-specific integrase-resolvase